MLRNAEGDIASPDASVLKKRSVRWKTWIELSMERWTTGSQSFWQIQVTARAISRLCVRIDVDPHGRVRITPWRLG